MNSNQSLQQRRMAAIPRGVGQIHQIYAERADFIRLQVGPFPTRDEAKRLCARLSAAGRSCFVVGS